MFVKRQSIILNEEADNALLFLSLIAENATRITQQTFATVSDMLGRGAQAERLPTKTFRHIPLFRNLLPNVKGGG